MLFPLHSLEIVVQSIQHYYNKAGKIKQVSVLLYMYKSA